MNRFQQRRQKRLQQPEIAAGYQEMRAELELMRALDAVREEMHITKEELAQRMGRKREAISRIFHDADANPTLDTITDLLLALGVTAEITLRRAQAGETPIIVERSSSY
jgi:transcriptional regulator with XRE-family HTH domain